MEQYGSFAYIYDELMDDVDYEMWTDHIEELIKLSGVSVKNILELACGTGNITIPLTVRGYDVAGIDISEEMLDVALTKSEQMNVPLVLLQQDIAELDFDIYDLDCVLCACDGFNYITDRKDLKGIFEKVHKQLKKGGLIIFDISSYYKLSRILGNNFMGETREELAYMWTNYFDESSDLLQMDLDFFVKVEAEDGEEDNLYERYGERHLQRAYRNEDIKKLLEETGFSDIKEYGDFTVDKPADDSERIFFTAVKK